MFHVGLRKKISEFNSFLIRDLLSIIVDMRKTTAKRNSVVIISTNKRKIKKKELIDYELF